MKIKESCFQGENVVMYVFTDLFSSLLTVSLAIEGYDCHLSYYTIFIYVSDTSIQTKN